MRRYRIGVFGWKTSPIDGGSDTLLRTLNRQLAATETDEAVEMVAIPPSVWSGWRRPLRCLWSRLVRRVGSEIPLIDLRPVCRRWRLDAVYFAAPVFARIDVPFVFTLWDLGHRTVPEFPEMRRGYDTWTRLEAFYRHMLPQASFVVVGNNAGAAEARELFGLESSRVIVIPFPNPDFSQVAEAVPPWLPQRPFFFYPAQGWPHKNHYTLLKALAILSGADRDPPDLVFVGSDKSNMAYLKSVAASLGVQSRVHFAGFVPRAQLKALYRRAAGLVFPSLLGPNNLPPQEAAILDCPVILSDLPGHREQLGVGALYVPPLNAEAWSDAMSRLMADADLRLTLIARAREVVAAYSADAYVARLKDIFSRLIAVRALWSA